MDFKSLYIRNFLTIGSAKIDLDNRGLILIQGVNNDDPSAKSNGAGKSSIVDALSWVLFGETARGVTGDSVINLQAGKDCHVSVIVEDGVETFEIMRGRKSKGIKNALIVRQILPAVVDLSKGTDKETQKVVEKIIGCSKEVFMAAVYAGQEQMPDLPGMTDKQLKLLIEEAAGVEVLSEAYTEARARALVADSAVKIAANELASARTNLTLVEGELRVGAEQKSLFEAGRKDKARAELTKVPPLMTSLAEARSILEALPDTASVKAQMDTARARIDDQKTEQKSLDALKGEASRTERNIASVTAEFAVAKKDFEREVRKAEDIAGMVGKPCGECGRPYCEHDLEGAKKKLETKAASKKDELIPLARRIKTLQEELKTRTDVATNYAAKMTDVSAVAREHAELSATLNRIDATARQISTFESQITAIKEAAKAHMTTDNPWVKIEEARREKRQQAENRVKTAEGDLLSAEHAAEIAGVAVKVFGPAGVRAHILDTVTPVLNEQTADYLGALADGNIHATWNTLSKTAKGELKEKFNIEVFNDKGADSFAGLSGGEKRKVRLSTAMALQDMVASRAAKPIGIFIADEVDHALDEAGLERLMTVLERKARDRGTVLVISHNSLAEWIDDVVVAEKTGGITTVTGATERGF